MARRKKKKFPILVIVLIGIVVVGIGLFPESFDTFTDRLQHVSMLLVPQELVGLQQFGCEQNYEFAVSGNVDFGEEFCEIFFDNYKASEFPVIIHLPLEPVDVLNPIILDYAYMPTGFNATECGSFVLEDLPLSLTDRDFSPQSNDNANSLANLTEGTIDIQPFLKQGQENLFLTLVPNATKAICPTFDVSYNVEIPTRSNNLIKYFPRPPEIRELSNQLLEQWLYLADYTVKGVAESSTSFAVAESFNLENPTVITDLRVRIGTVGRGSEVLGLDPTGRSLTGTGTTITAYVWNLDTSPPERISKSVETFSGIGGETTSRWETAEVDIDFTFADAVALSPANTYAVGIRVDQDNGQEFVYTKSDQVTNTHLCVIDRNSNANGESNFVSNGICGFDIFHNQFLASSLLGVGIQGIQGIQGEEGIQGIIGLEGQQGIQGVQGIQGQPAPTLTKDQLIANLCDGSQPELEICTTDPSIDLLNFLMIGGVTFNFLIIAGAIIVGLGIIGFFVRRRNG